LQESDFHTAVDDIFMDIEDRIDEQDADVDVDSSGGVLTLTFDDDSQVILSRQVAAIEIWVAARSGGFHLKQRQDGWLCSATGEDLPTLLNRVTGEQGSFRLFE
jgi:CyaY protein